MSSRTAVSQVHAAAMNLKYHQAMPYHIIPSSHMGDGSGFSIPVVVQPLRRLRLSPHAD